jgi:hypothetical protein
LLQNPLALSDPEYRRTLIDWGFRQIEVEFPLDPIRAPLNAIRRQLAILEWNRVIRTSGRDLRGVMAGQAVQELLFQLQRRQNQILAADAAAQQHRLDVQTSMLRIDEFGQTSAIQHRNEIDSMTTAHRLNQEAEEAASRRRINELIAATDQEATKMIIDAWLKSSGTTSAQQTVDATRLVNEEINRIRRDPNLSTDEQHLHIKTLLDTLPTLLRNQRAHDV